MQQNNSTQLPADKDQCIHFIIDLFIKTSLGSEKSYSTLEEKKNYVEDMMEYK